MLDSAGWVEYSFYVKASYAFEVLLQTGLIPADSVLMNETECPLDHAEELEAAS